MYLKYGSFQFEPWEATLQSVVMQTQYSVRGFKQVQHVQMFVEGTVVANGQYDVGARLAQIEAALADDGYDFGLYHDNGTPTQHFLQSNHPDNLTGNQIFQKHFPNEEGAEYITGRTFRFGVKAMLNVEETALLEYRDSYEAQGDCGPRYQWTESDQGVYVRRVAPATTQKVTHAGYAITSVPWFQPPAPYFQPPFLHSPLTTIRRTSPEGRYPQGFTGYRVDWSYHYELPVDTFGAPTIR